MHQLFSGRLWVRSAMAVAVVTVCGLVAMSCTSSSSPTAPEESAAGTLETTAGGAAPGPAPGPDVKTAICHFQKDLGTWKVTMLSSEALAAHLDKHDDAYPGERTAITETLLDKNCKKVQ
jgi:hypothetical protein